MKLEIKVGDVLDESADVLISTANPWLNMSGGVNAAILLRGGNTVQDELRACLARSGKPVIDPGTVVRTGPGPLSVKHILHAVAVNVFYESSIDLVRQTIEAALGQARSLAAITVAMPALATGYGPLAVEEFATALQQAVAQDWSPIARLTVVLRREEDAATVRRMVGSLQDPA